MPFHINSDDATSNIPYNDTWSFNSSLKGSYTVNGQYIDTAGIPWMWSGCNNLRIQFPFDAINYRTLVTLDVSLCNTNEYANIAALWQTNIQNQLNQLAIDSGGDVTVTCTVVYNAGGYFIFTFLGNEADGVNLLFADPLTTCASVFDKTSTMTAASIFNIYTTFMYNDPKYLEMYITESDTQYNTARNRSPTLLISTKDNEFTGQVLIFRNSISLLTIKIYRVNVPIVCPITNKWDIVLS